MELLVDAALSTGVVFQLVDPAPGRRCRWYRIAVEMTLWDGLDVVRRWGRHGSVHAPRRLNEAVGGDPRPRIRALVSRRLRRGYDADPSCHVA